MLVGIISNKLTSKKIISFYEMTNVDNEDGFEVYKNKNKILVVVENDELSIDKALIYLYSEYNPLYIFSFGLSEIINTQHSIGDIVLPNVFLELDDKIKDIEFRKENIDGFLKNAIFLENYKFQSDYDFNKFGLSIGGICVSGDSNINQELKEKIKLAYEADVYDKSSYLIINEAKKLNISERFYFIRALFDSKDLSGLDVIIENGLFILNFLLDNLSESEQEIGVDL